MSFCHKDKSQRAVRARSVAAGAAASSGEQCSHRKGLLMEIVILLIAQKRRRRHSRTHTHTHAGSFTHSLPPAKSFEGRKREREAALQIKGAQTRARPRQQVAS